MACRDVSALTDEIMQLSFFVTPCLSCRAQVGGSTGSKYNSKVASNHLTPFGDFRLKDHAAIKGIVSIATELDL